MWQNTYRSKKYGKRGRYFYEPLPTTAPSTARPYCCYMRTVIFYKSMATLEKYDELETQWDNVGQRHSSTLEGWLGVAPFVMHKGQLYELATGSVIWDKRWYMRWIGWRVHEDDRRLPYMDLLNTSNAP